MYKKAAHFVQGTGFRASPVGVGVNQNFPLSISHKGWLQELLECSKCGFLIKRSDVNEHLNSRCKLHRSTKVRLSIYLKKRDLISLF